MIRISFAEREVFVIRLTDLMQQPALENAVLFGVGCLYFDIDARDFKNWERHVREALDALPTVSDVEVEAYVDLGANRSDETDRLYPISASAQFTLRISEKAQIRLLEKTGGHDRQAVAEEFTVITYYEYHAPVTFVIPRGLKDLDSPSMAVIIVREYLKDALKNGSQSIGPCVVGPSPFHADLALVRAEQHELFTLERTASSAYDVFVFTASAEAMQSSKEACEELLDRIKDELSFYYRLQLNRITEIMATDELGALSGELIGIYEDKRVRGKIRRAFTSSSKARYLAVKAIVAQYNAEIVAARTVDNQAELYSSDVEPYFKSDIESVMAEDNSGPISGAREIAALISEVRARQVEASSVLLSAIAGGAAGALISLVVH
jgi:hypothetical protein